MRNQTTILLLLLVLCGIFAVLRFLPQPVPHVEIPQTPEPHRPPPQETATPIQPEPRPFAVWQTNLQTDSLTLSAQNKNHPKALFDKHLPALLTGKEGSYSNLTDLFQNSGSTPVNLRSDWITPYLLPGRSLPSLRMQFIKNLETGEYQPSGSMIALPGKGLEAGYEVSPGTDEQKATLQWKKSF